MDNKTIANPHVHYGAQKSATRLFLLQRLTGAVNILFVLFLVWMAVRLAGTERTEMLDVLGNPVVAILFSLLIANVCVHMRNGMNEVIEDYVHDSRLVSLSRLLNIFFALAVGIVAIGSLLKLAFGG